MLFSSQGLALMATQHAGTLENPDAVRKTIVYYPGMLAVPCCFSPRWRFWSRCRPQPCRVVMLFPGPAGGIVSALPQDPKERFARLFATRDVWTQQEILPYLK